MKEIWKDIEGYDGFYQVSNLGRVRSWKNARWGRCDKPHSLTLSNHAKGYTMVTLGQYEKKTVHRLVAEAFIPNPENKSQVNHINGNKADNRVKNLEWVTNQENRDHAVEHGLHLKGEDCPQAKLTETDVLDIRAAHNLGCFMQKELAEVWGVHPMTIKDIVNNITWKHL